MWIVAVALLVAGVAGAVGHLHRPWLAVVPPLLALVAVVAGVVDVDPASDALGDLVEPLIFVLLAVPLAVLLDERGCFDAVARRIPPRWTGVGLWALGAATVALVNLDAAVVLLTPVAIRAAARAGEDARALALQPALLASLSSSWLPVSNLTNLIAEEHHRQGPAAYLAHLGLPSLAAVVVGYALWRRMAPRRIAAEEAAAQPPEQEADDRDALLTAVAVALVLLVGFTGGAAVGIPPWVVVAIVVTALVVRSRAVPVAAVPWSSALVVAGLAVLAVAVAERVDVASALGDGEGPAGLARIVGVGALGANVANNLPTFVAGLPHLPTGGAAEASRWAWLLGVNMGPTVVATGSLAGLLWVDVARRSGLAVGARDYARAGLRVGLPALVVATVVLTLVA